MSAPFAVMPPAASWPEEPRSRLSPAELVRAAAVAPLWLACAAGWGLTSATMLTWSAVREMPWLER